MLASLSYRGGKGAFVASVGCRVLRLVTLFFRLLAPRVDVGTGLVLVLLGLLMHLARLQGPPDVILPLTTPGARAAPCPDAIALERLR